MKIRSLVLLFLLVLSPTLCLSAGLPFYKAKAEDRAKLNAILGLSVQKSLKEDTRGNKPIVGSYATPQIIFDAVRKYHPASGLKNVGDLPAYIHSLSSRPAPQGEKCTLTRIIKDGKKYTIGTRAREFYKDELVWFDVNTGEDILAGYCANIIVPKPKAESVVKSKPVLAQTKFEFCSEYVAEQGERVALPLSVCSATKYVELRYPGEAVPVVYGICDDKGRPVFLREARIIIEDYDDKGNDLVQDNAGLYLNKSEGCTQVMIKRGHHFQSLDPFDSKTTDGQSNEIRLSAEGISEAVKPLAIQWGVRVKENLPREEVVLRADLVNGKIVAKASNQNGGFISGVLRLVVQEGRRDRVLFRANPREDGTYTFGKLSKGKYLVTFSRVVERRGLYFLEEKKAVEVEVK